ncbi:hypothetical protein ABZV58_29165 [Nocardia sp. NPDC004654]|uniref:hypothetical protein n=1 Tax=Nocardia sp. NPDC004654 TaxID=3154776 RepID=UPI0033A35A6E
MPHPILATDPPCALCWRRNASDWHQLDDQLVCGSCFPALPQCERCYATVRSVVVVADERQLCRSCTRGWVGCVSCRELTDPHVRTDTDEPVCLRCAAVFFDSCVNCGRYSAASRYVSGGTRACTRCAGTYASCPQCATLLRPGRGCDPCARRDRVWNYSYKPDPRFHGDGPLYLGMELEVIVPDYCYDEAVAAATEHLGDLGYLKQDSSIRPLGFEVVTHPMSYRHAIDHFPWGLLTVLEDLDCETDQTVGLHVHASRDGFDSPAHIYRWLKLLYRNESAVTILARRRSRYAPFDRIARAKARETAKSHQHALGLARYQAINPYPRKTLELRVFASSLDVQCVQAALAFTAASIDYTRALRVADVRAGAWEWSAFGAWVARQPDYQPLAAEMEDLACAC